MILDSNCREISPCAQPTCAPGAAPEFEFTLKIRVECLRELRQAAARRWGGALQEDDLSELLGPEEDPSLRDCLMALALPQAMAGCTMLSVTID